MITNFDRKPTIDDFLPCNHQKIIKFTCTICHSILMNPVCDQSCHLFCKDCALDYITKKSACPINNECILSLESITEVPNISEFLSRQEIKCLNHVKGCTWIGYFSLLTNHLSSQCPKQEILCPYQQNGCEVNLLRERLNEHIIDCPFRSIQCRNQCAVDEIIIFKDEQSHLDKCPNEVINCPNNCGARFERKGLRQHCEECAHALFPCVYEEYGCTTKVLNKNRDNHISSFVHQHNFLVIKYVKETQEEIEKKSLVIEEMQKNLKEKIEKCSKLRMKYSNHYTNLLKSKTDNLTGNEDKDNDKEKDKDQSMMYLMNKTEREQQGRGEEEDVIDEDREVDDEEMKRKKQKMAEKLSLSLFSEHK